MQVVPKVHLLAIPEDNHLTRLTSTNVFLIGEREAVMVDSGLGNKESNEMILNGLSEVSAKLSYILVTHCHWDHLGGAKAIKEATGAKIAVHSQSIGVMEGQSDSLVPDVILEHGSLIEVDGLTVEVVHTPGHTPGDICLFLRDGGILFTGDTILGVGTVVLDGNVTQYMNSLRRLLEYGAKVICPGHGPIVNDATAKINEIIDHRNMREKQIIDHLVQGDKSPRELVLAIYSDVDTRLHQAAERNVNGHLLKLIEEDRVRKIDAESGPVYQLAR